VLTSSHSFSSYARDQYALADPSPGSKRRQSLADMAAEDDQPSVVSIYVSQEDSRRCVRRRSTPD
jgi:hypothetical protein